MPKCECKNSRGSCESFRDDGHPISVCVDCNLERYTDPGNLTKGEWGVFLAEEAEDLVTLDDQPRPSYEGKHDDEI